MSVNEYLFETREAAIDALYRVFVDDLRQRLPATLLLSGGSTPGPLYRKLSQADLDWEKISVALVDERWVEPEHAASNERLLREQLLRRRAAGASFTGLYSGDESAFAGQAASNSRYAALPRPYRICLLGMGSDGHTASLFPGAQGLDAALESRQYCAPIQARRSEVTGDFVERMTMTPWAILQSEKLILLISGEDKWETYRRARQNSANMALPISLFIHQDRVPLDVYWSP